MFFEMYSSPTDHTKESSDAIPNASNPTDADTKAVETTEEIRSLNSKDARKDGENENASGKMHEERYSSLLDRSYESSAVTSEEGSGGVDRVGSESDKWRRTWESDGPVSGSDILIGGGVGSETVPEGGVVWRGTFA